MYILCSVHTLHSYYSRRLCKEADEMITFKWPLVIAVCGINIHCIGCVSDPGISTNNSSIPSTLETQVIKANPHSTTAIFTSPPTYYDFVCQSQFFVDNSLLIEYVLQHPITLITLARRFGKSLNINMIKTFLTIEVDRLTAEIIPKSENQTEAYQIFDSGILKLKRKTIELEPKPLIKQREDIMAQMNSFPVIHLNLGSPSQRYNSLKDVCTFIIARSMNTFDDHQYLEILNTPTAVRYKKALSNLESIDCASQFNLVPHPINQLTSTLFSHFGEKVVVLIDEYDAVLNKIFIESTNHTEEFKKGVIGYFANFFGTLLKDNNNVKTAVITGIIPWKNSGIFSQFGHIAIKTMADDEPLQCYGISPENVKDMLKISNKGVLNDTTFTEVEGLYDGYLFGTQHLVKKFNPLSIAMFFNNKQILRGYWTESGDISELLKKLIKFRNFNLLFSKLLLGADILISNDTEQISAIDLKLFSPLMDNVANLEENEWDDSNEFDISTAFYMMYFAGYITLSNHTAGSEMWMRIPNREVMDHLWDAYYISLSNGRKQRGKGKRFEMKIDAFANEYGKTILTDHCDVSAFTKTFYEYVHEFPTPMKKRNINGMYMNEKLIELFVGSIHVLHYPQVYLEVQRNFKKTKKYLGGIPDLVSIYNETLVVIEFKCCAQSAVEAWNQTGKYEQIFLNHPEYTDIKKMKKIGMMVHSDLSVEVMMQFGRLRLGENKTIDWDAPTSDKLSEQN